MIAEDKRKITVGDRIYTIEAFRGSKGVRVLAAVAAIGKQAKPVLDEWNTYDRLYRENNSAIITRELAEVRAAQAPDDESRLHWQRFLDGPLKDRVSVSIPQSPTMDQKLITFFPQFFEMAEDEVTRLLALMLIPNVEMKAARRDGSLAEKLQALGEEILDELEIQEMATLILTCVEIIQEQFKDTQDTVGKFRELLASRQPSVDQEQEVENDPRQMTPVVGSVVPQTPSEPSSTDSPAPMDGPLTESSSENSGLTSMPTAN